MENTQLDSFCKKCERQMTPTGSLQNGFYFYCPKCGDVKFWK